jgi:hypothetical protein
MPIGQSAGRLIEGGLFGFVNEPSGSRRSRSNFSTKVMIGTSRNRQTSKSLRGLLLDAPVAPLGAASIRPLPNPSPQAGEGRVG